MSPLATRKVLKPDRRMVISPRQARLQRPCVGNSEKIRLTSKHSWQSQNEVQTDHSLHFQAVVVRGLAIDPKAR